MAQKRRWLMRIAKAMGRYLVNGYAIFKIQTGEGNTPLTCLLTYSGKVKSEIEKNLDFFSQLFQRMIHAELNRLFGASVHFCNLLVGVPLKEVEENSAALNVRKIINGIM